MDWCSDGVDNEFVHVDDPVDRSSSGGIEVSASLADGSTRWCFSIAPEALANCGDTIGCQNSCDRLVWSWAPMRS